MCQLSNAKRWTQKSKDKTHIHTRLKKRERERRISLFSARLCPHISLFSLPDLEEKESEERRKSGEIRVVDVASVFFLVCSHITHSRTCMRVLRPPFPHARTHTQRFYSPSTRHYQKSVLRCFYSKCLDGRWKIITTATTMMLMMVVMLVAAADDDAFPLMFLFFLCVCLC